MRRTGDSIPIKRSAVYGVLLAFFAVTVFPMVWVGYTSLKPSRQVFLDPFALPGPGEVTWSNYASAWTVGRFGDYFLNSVGITLATVLLTVGLGAMAAYALARFAFPGARAALFFFLAGLMVPIQLAAVPLFFELKAMGLLGSRTGLVLVYVASGLPFAVFVLVGFFRSLPSSLHESAVLDGCDEARAFWHVMLPLAQPGLVTVAIFTFVAIWNEYLLAFLFLSGQGAEGLRTLPLGLANLTIVSQYRTDWGMVFAGIVIVVLPTLVVYTFLQRHLTEGVRLGALK